MRLAKSFSVASSCLPSRTPRSADADGCDCRNATAFASCTCCRSHTIACSSNTYFSDGSYLDVEAPRREITSYVESRGLEGRRGDSRRNGRFADAVGARCTEARAPLVAGYAGGWFHPVTGYSFPIAARLAALVASLPAEALFGHELATFAAAHARQLAFAQRLTHMLFHWFAPDQRHHARSRGLPASEQSIARFYALELTAFDRARLLAGRPPRGMSWRAMLGFEGDEVARAPRIGSGNARRARARVRRARAGASAPDPHVPDAVWHRALTGPAEEFLARPGKELRASLVRIGWLLAGGSEAAMPERLAP